MATPTVAAPVTRHRASRRLVRIFLVLLVLVVVGASGVCVWFYRTARAALPQLDGNIAVQGLRASVTVIRDAHGVPHITAASLDDLFFAQGYITAQDRLWQLDITRRYAGAELSEIFPASSAPPVNLSRATSATAPRLTWIDHDKRQRILRLRAVAELVAQQLPQRERNFFEAYAKGVNAFMEQHREHLPIEFRVLNYSPRPWTVTDSVLVGISMSQLLNSQFEPEYWRARISTKVAPELIADLYPVGSWHDRPPASAANDGAAILALPDEPDDQQPPDKSISQLRGAALPQCESCTPGSNNWVVSGAHTTTGKPLLSSDMHLPHQLPGVWFE